VKIDHFVGGSIGVGLLVNRLRHLIRPSRWYSGAAKPKPKANLVQIRPSSEKALTEPKGNALHTASTRGAGGL